MVKVTKSKTFQAYLPNCHRTYSCVHCRAHLANHDELISKASVCSRNEGPQEEEHGACQACWPCLPAARGWRCGELSVSVRPCCGLGCDSAPGRVQGSAAGFAHTPSTCAN